MYKDIKLTNKNRINKLQAVQGQKKQVRKAYWSRFWRETVQNKVRDVQSRYDYVRYDPKWDRDMCLKVRYLEEQFYKKVAQKYSKGTSERRIKLGYKDKYQRNLQVGGRFIAKNPIVAAFQGLGKAIQMKQKKFGFDVLKYYFKSKNSLIANRQIN